MKNTDNKEKIWKCEKCKLEHKIKTLFCDGKWHLGSLFIF